jgi:hypothetical protein
MDKIESTKDLDAAGEKQLSAAIEEFRKTTVLLDDVQAKAEIPAASAATEKAEPSAKKASA